MLEIKNFSKVYKGGKRAVDHFNLTVEAGDIYGFIGHNGAGKSTTIKAIAGVLDFEEGEIFVDGHSVEKSPVECKKVIAYIPDNPDLYEHLTGIQYLIHPKPTASVLPSSGGDETPSTQYHLRREQAMCCKEHKFCL